MMKREKNHAALATFITRMVTTTVTPIVIGIAPASAMRAANDRHFLNHE
jgi:hypothetical protein